MATIKIRGRKEVITLDDDRAKKLKNRKFGLNQTAKADPQDLVDLGVWAGEYGRIIEIEITGRTETVDQRAKQAAKDKAEEERWMKSKPEVKAQGVGRFKLVYASRLGDFSAQPSKDVLKKVEKVQCEFYKKNPNTRHLPLEAYGDLLPPVTEKSATRATVAKKMSATMANKENGRKCKKCDTPLTGNVKDYCSGSCMLAAENGEVKHTEDIDSIDNSDNIKSNDQESKKGTKAAQA
jgi:hypothetical protein